MRDNLCRVVDYAANPEKTEYGALAQALHYAGNDAKTTLPESAKLVSGIHCRPETAWADMRSVQRKFGKTEGVVAMHAYQSFQPGEVTPEQCHAIGVALARQVWGERFQVLVATHMNTHCLHNHFVINAVSYVDGKKYEQRRNQYRELRRASDALYRAQGLSVVQSPGKGSPRPLYEAERRGEPTRYNRMREALRSALQQTSTEEDFALALRRIGYLWRREEGRKYATLRSVDGGRPVRVHRLGSEFDWPCFAICIPERRLSCVLPQSRRTLLKAFFFHSFTKFPVQTAFFHFVNFILTPLSISFITNLFHWIVDGKSVPRQVLETYVFVLIQTVCNCKL